MNNLTLEQCAEQYAQEKQIEYITQLDYLEQQDPAEQQAANDIYDEAYEEYLLDHYPDEAQDILDQLRIDLYLDRELD